MSKLQMDINKCLKLINVIKCNVEMSSNLSMECHISKMEQYIKSKGLKKVGPLIQYMNTYVNGVGGVEIEIVFMIQCSDSINSIEKPYSMESIVYVPNCMYVRYMGPEEKLQYAYDKINLEAFESETELRGDSYTIFVDRNVEEDIITADIFMAKKEC